MNISEIIKSFELDMPTIQAILGAYINDELQGSAVLRDEIKARIMEDDAYSSNAMRAVTEAVIYSTCLMTMVEDQHFEESLQSLEVIDDDFLRKMRFDIFQEAALELNTESDMDDVLTVKNRILTAKEVFLAVE